MSLPTGLPLPPDEMRFMGDRGDRLLEIGREVLAIPRRAGFLPLDGFVLDIGCGYGRLAYALAAEGFHGRYLGLDILERHIGWLQQNLTPAAGFRAEFEHLDVRNDRYNREGRGDPRSVCLPPLDRVPDLVTLISVFTHLYPDEVLRYFTILREILGPASTCYATFFLLDAESRALEAAGRSAFPMPHVLASHCRYHNPEDPLHAIGYEAGWVAEMLDQHGLQLLRRIPGGWCGRKGTESYQDGLLIQRRPEGPAAL